MATHALSQAVNDFTQLVQGLSDASLDLPWAWGDYESEGIRFACFRTYEELQELAVRVLAERTSQGCPQTPAQRILTLYQRAYRELGSILLGLPPDVIETRPAPADWSIGMTFAHMVGADVAFYVAVRYALDGLRLGDGRPAPIPDAAWDAIVGMDEPAYRAIMQGPFAGVQDLHQHTNDRILHDFAGITAVELDAPSWFWESYALPIRFRLHRFDSHLRQHTIQVEKTLVALGQPSAETRRLTRLIASALAEVEGASLGFASGASVLSSAAAASIAQRTKEIANSLPAPMPPSAGLREI